ncbi:MAG: hypothetical protein HY690_11205 [Chloroflexi bacterium]|nr:hypothetical protein [Chloroflexota bacterium]
MRLRSIPPRTMGTLAAKRKDPPGRWQGTWGRGDAERDAVFPRLRVSPAGERPPGPAGGYGRVYHRPAGRARPIDVLIPPRPALSRRPATHTISETAEAHSVRIAFPSPVRPDEVHWELHGDVLEVEYLGRAFTYNHAFLVPSNVEPTVEQDAHSLTFRFPRQA